MPHKLCLAILFALLIPMHGLAQETTPEPDAPLIIPRERASLREGPGHTHPQSARLDLGDTDITIVARNRIGSWVKIKVKRDSEVFSGWVLTGYLELDETIQLGDYPVEDRLPDAVPENVNSRSQSMLYRVDVLPRISDAMIEVYERGQQNGIQPNVVTKIGDSLSASRVYLTAISRPDPQLGPYAFLQETVDYFGPSLAEPSVASEIGLSTYGVFDPFWADRTLCEANESPLDCELRRKMPLAVFILFGPNDVRAMTADEYETQMRLMIETMLDHGTIPILSTFSADPDEAFWWQSIGFNQVLIDLAAEYDVPVINLWAAARVLPTYGLDQDQIHLKHSGQENLYYINGQEAYYGVSLQNLLALATLHELRMALGLG